MSRKHVPDLDLLESPLISANPVAGSILGVVPGSALAEKIFNDPQSWQGTLDDDDTDLKDKEDLIWPRDEVTRQDAKRKLFFTSPVDHDVDISRRPLSERFNLASLSEQNEKKDTLSLEDKKPILPLFPPLDLSLDLDLRLSKIWDYSGRRSQQKRSSLKSPANDSSTTKASKASNSEGTRLMLPPELDLASDRSLSPLSSVVPVASASTTWSILEYYVHPGTPRGSARASFPPSYPSTPFQKNTLFPPSFSRASSTASARSEKNEQMSTLPPPLRPNTPLPPAPALPTRSATPPINENTPIRRLPVIPDRARSSPSPTPTPVSTKSVNPPRPTPCSSTSLPPLNTSQAGIFTPSTTPTPVRSGSLFTRSPPAGPRPRSANTPPKRHPSCGRQSPSSFVIAPAPAPISTRTRRP